MHAYTLIEHGQRHALCLYSSTELCKGVAEGMNTNALVRRAGGVNRPLG
jgi:hypothetical protein